jgi:hypothetical protein
VNKSFQPLPADYVVMQNEKVGKNKYFLSDDPAEILNGDRCENKAETRI